MNYLAHTILATTDIDFQIGNVSADAMKGKHWEGCSEAHRAGIAMHKFIDRYTDEHHIVQQATHRLGKGYLRGVIIDIAFDHFLSKHWDTFITIPKPMFIQCFYRDAGHNIEHLPATGRAFINRLISHDILSAYEDFNNLAIILTRLNRRLSPALLKKENATDYLPRLATKYHSLEEDFCEYFPLLIEQFLEKSQAQKNQHYFR